MSRWMKHGPVFLVVALICTSLSCSREAEPSPVQKEGNAQTSVPVELAPVSVLIAHRVADYAAWKSSFDDGMQSRKDASCLGHYLKRGLGDDERVYIYCLASDAERLRTFLDSAELSEAMQQSEVIGEPEVTMMRPVSRDLVAGEKLPGIIVMHEVEDYASWRVQYEAFEEYRRSHGIIGQAVSQSFDNPEQVIIYHQANEEQTLRSFVDSAELRESMEIAGVLGEPDIRFIEIVDFASY